MSRLPPDFISSSLSSFLQHRGRPDQTHGQAPRGPSSVQPLSTGLPATPQAPPTAVRHVMARPALCPRLT